MNSKTKKFLVIEIIILVVIFATGIPRIFSKKPVGKIDAEKDVYAPLVLELAKEIISTDEDFDFVFSKSLYGVNKNLLSGERTRAGQFVYQNEEQSSGLRVHWHKKENQQINITRIFKKQGKKNIIVYRADE